ncbi:uncharacterized protein LOC119605609 [Lucilia sericata]|uniref:uncharacterized protein LOC119605609 n=1 Tax=Lucilia sericata TaxID=13632 RepID=UPI0018A86648|nr:uncharacterized protein LOC119605609 [Lucilia sericata]
MHDIKYQPLKNNDEDPSITDSNFDTYRSVSNEFKKYWLLKVLLICFIIVKAIYVINNFETIINWLQNHNRTDINYNETDIFENVTNIYEEDSLAATTILYDFVNKTIVEENHYLATTSSSNITNNTTFITTTDTTYTNNATAASNNYYEITTKKLYKDEKTMENNNDIQTNDYNNVDSTTLKLETNFKDDAKTTTTTSINLNSNNNNIATIENLTTTTTAMYLNNTIITSTLLQTTEIVTGPPISRITTTTTTSKPMTPPPLKIPDVKPSSPTNELKKYFINTSHCHIPYVDPFTSDVRKIFKPQHSTGCTKDQPIIRASFNELDYQYHLHINYTIAEELRKDTNKSNPIEEDVLCCYQEILRSGSGSNVDASFKLLPCTNFHQDFVVPLHINGIIVNCKSKSKKSTLQEDAFSFIQVNKTIIQQESKNVTVQRRKPSILMIGIDTLSRINFRRNMPEMLKYLVKNNWYELLGYNKVGDNTLPNLMPMLAGYTRNTVNDKCNPRYVVGGFDNCNFIWTTFKKHGYHTGYAEDATTITTFNYKLKGFKNPPTDYYFRPIALAIEKSMKKKTKAGLNYCVGRRQYGEYVYDYGTEFVKRYKNLTSFGFFWTNSFSHNSYDVSATMDNTMVKYFKEWEKQGIFDNSVVMFFSDHGVRWGPLLKLSQSFLEERLPMFFISLPKWFRQEYPKLVRNLEINQKRLVNPFDINMTLQHLLKLGEPTYEMQQTFDCPKCQSIFEEIPENRTCEDASIPETWCTCKPFRAESTKNEEVKTVAKLIIEEMNRYYELKNITSLCSPLQLKEITNAKVSDADESSQYITTYVIDFATDPKTEPKTLFSATLDYNRQNKSIILNVDDISRQSLYEKTAKCIDDKQAKKYCICKNSLKLPK